MPTSEPTNEEILLMIKQENDRFLKKIRAIAQERDLKLIEIIRRIEAKKLEDLRREIGGN